MKNPSYEEFLNWVLENDPTSFQPWNPPLTLAEKSILSDPQLKDEPFSQETCETLKAFFPLFNYIREAQQTELTEKQITFLLEKLNKVVEDKKNSLKSHDLSLYKEVLKKHRIRIEKIIDDVVQQLLNKIEQILSVVSKLNLLEEWTADNYTITHLPSKVEIGRKPSQPYFGPFPTRVLERKIFEHFKNSILQAKIADIKKNPQNWKFEKKKKYVWRRQQQSKQKRWQRRILLNWFYR